MAIKAKAKAKIRGLKLKNPKPMSRKDEILKRMEENQEEPKPWMDDSDSDMDGDATNERSQAIHEIVREQMIEANESDRGSGRQDFPDDPSVLLSGPEYIREKQRAEDEIVIDELISGIPKNQGYYMLLYRELSPNQFELKDRIDHFHHWTDMELEVMNFVRANTQKNPRKWGSGRYRIHVKREKGLRGPKYDPLDFIIDANDHETEIGMQKVGVVDPLVSAEAQFENLAKLLGSVKNIMPTAPNPGDVQQQMAQAFQQGLSANTQDQTGAASQNNQMMLMMMTMMQETFKLMQAPKDVTPQPDPSVSLASTIGMLKDMGMFPKPTENKDDFMESLVKMKTIGIDPFKQADPLAQITQMKAIAGVIGDFAGMNSGSGERPGIAEKLIDAVVPILPDVFNNIGKMSDNYTQLQVAGGKQPQQIQQIPKGAPPSVSQSPRNSIPHNGENPVVGGVSGGQRPEEVKPNPTPQEEQSMLAKLFFGRLKKAIIAQDRQFFPELHQLMKNSPGGSDIVSGIMNGTINDLHLETLIKQWGGIDFSGNDVKPFIRPYSGAFIQYMKQQNTDQSKSTTPVVPIIGKCMQCQAEFEFETREMLISENICDVESAETGSVCGGQIMEDTVENK